MRDVLLMLAVAQLGGAVVVGTVVWRSRALASMVVPGELGPLCPEEVAYLAGGPRRALLAAISWLRAAGAIDAVAGTVRVTAAPPVGAGRITGALHARAAYGAVTGRTWGTAGEVVAALAAARDRLVGSGLLRDCRRIGNINFAPVYGIVAATIMFAATVAWTVGVGTALAVLVASLAPGVATALALEWATYAPRPTRDGFRLLTELRQRYVLRGADVPDDVLLDPSWAATSVALRGMAAMSELDRAFVDRMQLPIPQATGPFGGGGFRVRGDARDPEHQTDPLADNGKGVCWDAEGWLREGADVAPS